LGYLRAGTGADTRGYGMNGKTKVGLTLVVIGTALMILLILKVIGG